MSDPTTLSPVELEQAGVMLSGYCPTEMRPKAGTVWKSHSEYLTDNPQVDWVQRAEARRAATAWLLKHGSLVNLILPRSFPCLGRFRIVMDDGKRPATVVCDVCGYALGVSQKVFVEEAKQEVGW